MGLAQSNRLLPKHAIKQVDRLLSNEHIEVNCHQSLLAKLLIGYRQQIIVAMDWTVFAKDHQMTLTLRLITRHGRATPLLWITVSTIDLKDKKNGYVFLLLEKLRRLVPISTQVIVLADREFGTLNNMKKLKEKLDFDYILRIKRNFTVTDSKKHIKKLAHEWFLQEGNCSVENGYLTLQEYPVKKIIIAKERGMKDLWCLACSTHQLVTQTILHYYAKRWSTETSDRDEKDLHFGMGLKKARIKHPKRRDRLLLLSAIAIIFLTLLGAASEAMGFDKYIKSNTAKKRTHSLFMQGRILLGLQSNWSSSWRRKLFWHLQPLLQELKGVSSAQFVI